MNTLNDWHGSDYAHQFYSVESPFLDAGLRQCVGPSVLQLGDNLEQSVVDDLELPYLLKASFADHSQASVILDPAFLPFSKQTFSTVVLPHVLETHALPHQLLREAHRVLQSEGHIVLTGFNPNSLVGIQRCVRPSSVSPGRYYSVGRVVDWLQLLGFEVVTKSLFQFAPISKHDGIRKTLHFIETVGDRWLPMIGGGYMICAKKSDSHLAMVGRLAYKHSHSKLIPAAARKESLSDDS